MKAVIFAGGDIKNYDAVKRHLAGADIIICADGGVYHAFRMGVKPGAVVGDMDSITGDDLRRIEAMKIERIKFPPEKDFTDTELALEIALQKGASEAVILAGVGDRPDHSLANMLLLVNFKKRGLEVKLAGENWEMFLIQGEKEISGQKGDLLSLIPLGAEAEEIETGGLYYPLRRETLPMGSSRGISNVFLGEKATVKVRRGLLLGVKLDMNQKQNM